jgi:hypothetical protein
MKTISVLKGEKRHYLKLIPESSISCDICPDPGCLVEILNDNECILDSDVDSDFAFDAEGGEFFDGARFAGFDPAGTWSGNSVLTFLRENLLLDAAATLYGMFSL